MPLRRFTCVLFYVCNNATAVNANAFMGIIEKPTNTHEQVLIGRDAESGYHGIIAIHSTVLGPAVGGTRFWN